jgi:hypothetical protein
MQERCRYQHVAILGRENLRHPTRLASDGVDMCPAVPNGAISRSTCAFAHGSKVMARRYIERLTARRAVLLAA